MKTIDKLTKDMEELEKRHPSPPDTGSEFGKGFLYCLAMFITHFDNSTADRLNHIQFVMSKPQEERDLILIDNPDDRHNYGWNKDVKWWIEKIVPIYGNWERAFSSDLTTWANGSSDHLYELECPEVYKGTEIEKKVEELRDLGLDMGHGRGLMGEAQYTWENFVYLKKLTAQIFKLVDEKLGVEVIEARWGEL